MFDFSNLILNTFKSNFPIELYRKSGSYVDGKYVPITPVKEIIEGSCSNLTGKDLKLLPENLRSEASMQLFTVIDIPLDSDVSYRSKRYKVIMSEQYDDIAQSGHWKSVLKLYSKGYNDAGQETERDPVPQPAPAQVENKPVGMTGEYINGIWVD